MHPSQPYNAGSIDLYPSFLTRLSGAISINPKQAQTISTDAAVFAATHTPFSTDPAVQTATPLATITENNSIADAADFDANQKQKGSAKIEPAINSSDNSNLAKLLPAEKKSHAVVQLSNKDAATADATALLNSSAHDSAALSQQTCADGLDSTTRSARHRNMSVLLPSAEQAALADLIDVCDVKKPFAVEEVDAGDVKKPIVNVLVDTAGLEKPSAAVDLVDADDLPFGEKSARRRKASVLLPSAQQAYHAKQAQQAAIGHGVSGGLEDVAVGPTAEDSPVQVHSCMLI